ncbi:NFU1 iron-sulfur cluster scaffold homolog, mitochondrial [Alphaproteobacteria bacterium]
MNVKIQETPDPHTLKFVLNKEILEQHVTYLFQTEQESKVSPLAQEIFKLTGIKSILLGSNFVSITKNHDVGWDKLQSRLSNIVVEYVSSEQEMIIDYNFYSDQDNDDSKNLDDEIVKQIIELIDTMVRPTVAEDGGDIKFASFKDGVVYLTLHGACSGCPGATFTLKVWIENMLKRYIPEVIEVRQVE